MSKRTETPQQLAERCIKWMQTPAGKRAARKAKAQADHTRELFKQRPFTTEELNRRYKAAV